MRDSTIEKLLNGETTDLFEAEENEEDKRDPSPPTQDPLETAIDLENSRELNELLGKSPPRVVENSITVQQDVSVINPVISNPIKDVKLQEIDDFLEEELNRNNAEEIKIPVLP